MCELNKIHDAYYVYKNGDHIYTYRKHNRGIWGYGKSWCLTANYGSKPEVVASFVVKDDGHGVYREDYGARLWTDEEALKEANRLINKIENCM